jgi:hypothetical protein
MQNQEISEKGVLTANSMITCLFLLGLPVSEEREYDGPNTGYGWSRHKFQNFSFEYGNDDQDGLYFELHGKGYPTIRVVGFDKLKPSDVKMREWLIHYFNHLLAAPIW